MDNLNIQDAGTLAVLGYAVVFFGLILLMIVVICIGKSFSRKKVAKTAAPTPAPVAEPANPSASTESTLAPGSAGSLKLYDTPPKIAAMLMAIVADTTGKPLNELRFISIKEVK